MMDLSRLNYAHVMKPEDINIAHLWTVFAGLVLSPGAPTLQRQEMRRAFYAGFVECFKITVDLSTALPEADACRVLDGLSKEANAFVEEYLREGVK